MYLVKQFWHSTLDWFLYFLESLAAPPAVPDIYFSVDVWAAPCTLVWQVVSWAGHRSPRCSSSAPALGGYVPRGWRGISAPLVHSWLLSVILILLIIYIYKYEGITIIHWNTTYSRNYMYENVISCIGMCQAIQWISNRAIIMFDLLHASIELVQGI